MGYGPPMPRLFRACAFSFSLRLLLLALLGLGAAPLAAQERVTVAYPGPLNIPLLPLDLAAKIGADRAEGIVLVARHVSGGVALRDLETRNVDFAVPGVPAAMSARARGDDVVVIAPLNDLPVYVLAVRSELKGQVRRPRDLAGRPVGVTTSTRNARTTSHQVAELVLHGDGVPPDQLRLVAIGQSWEEQSAALKSGTVDAILGFEPFPTRLRDAGLVYFLFDLADPAQAARLPGAAFLLAGLVTRSDVLRLAPQKAAKLVATLRRTLQWIAGHTPEQIVAALELDDAEVSAALLKSLRQYPRLYSPDGRFSARQIVETDGFFRAVGGADRPVALGAMIDDRWAGRKP
jgi:NitT/TauT family transport system substrate-binding protein